jgi:hypothetical protein
MGERSLMKLITISFLLSIALAKEWNPEELFSRTDERWKDYPIQNEGTLFSIGKRIDIHEFYVIDGSIMTLIADALRHADRKCVGEDCTPMTVAKINNDCLRSGQSLMAKLDIVNFNFIIGKKFERVKENLSNPDVFQLFTSDPIANCGGSPQLPTVCNHVGLIYDVDLENETFSYIDDLGNMGNLSSFSIDMIMVFTLKNKATSLFLL